MKPLRMALWATPILLVIGMLVIASTALAVAPAVGEALCGTSFPPTVMYGLRVKKDVFCKTNMVWEWLIEKSADQSSLTLSEGQVFPVNYTVKASATSAGTYDVIGDLVVTNLNSFPVEITSITDSMGPVDCGSASFTLAPGATLHCTYSGSDTTPAAANVVTVKANVGGSDVEVEATAPIDWSKAAKTEIDECVDVSDTFKGALGTVCAGTETSFTFKYTREVSFAVCGDYTVDNTASFLTNDSGASGSSSVTIPVDVPCAEGCSLTPGYWKTHSRYGPAPYDSIWAMIGEDTAFFFSGKSYYQALWTPPQGNAYYILAHAYIAAKLNQLNGADFSAAQAAFDQATALFSNPANTPAYIGGLRGNNALRQQFISLGSILDNYNNGLIGPGHCSE